MSFTKYDLKNEMICKTRNGKSYLVFGERIIGELGFMPLDKYCENFRVCSSNREFDIVAVYPGNKIYGKGLNGMLKPCEKPLWEETKIQLSDDERVILSNVDQKYEWIARDRNGMIFIYQKKPLKRRENWFYSCDCMKFEFVSNLFQWCKWKDDEPVNFRELLKGE